MRKWEWGSQKRHYQRSAAGTLLDRGHLERYHIDLSLPSVFPGNSVLALSPYFLRREIGKVASLCMYFLLSCRRLGVPYRIHLQPVSSVCTGLREPRCLHCQLLDLLKCAYPEEPLLRRAVLMCNTAISKALLSLLPFSPHVCSVGKRKMVLFASHQAMLNGRGERAFANEEHGMF